MRPKLAATEVFLKYWLSEKLEREYISINFKVTT